MTPKIKREMRRRSAVEPVIGHLKSEHRMGGNYLRYRQGDAINAVLAAAGYNFTPHPMAERLVRNELSDFSKLWYPRCVRTHGGDNMWTETTRRQYRREDLRYASDMTDPEWALIEPHLPAAKPLGRPRCVARRRLWWPLDDNYIGRLGFAEAEVIKVPPAIAGGTLNVRQAGH